MAEQTRASRPTVDPLVEIRLFDSTNVAHTTVVATGCLLEEDGSVWAVEPNGRRTRLLRANAEGARFPFSPAGVAENEEILWISLQPKNGAGKHTLSVSAVRDRDGCAEVTPKLRRHGVLEIGINWHNGALQLFRPAGELESKQVLSQRFDGRWSMRTLGPTQGGALLITDAALTNPAPLV